MGPGSWPTQTAAKANDRWWEALLAAAAATCYLGVDHFQQAKIKSKTFGRRFSSPSDETMSSKQSGLHRFNTKQVHRHTQRLTEAYMIVVFVRGGGAVPCVTSSFYRRLPHVNMGLLLLACDWWPCRLCFPSRAIIRQNVCEGHQCQGQCLGLPGLAPATFVCMYSTCEHGFSPVCTPN